MSPRAPRLGFFVLASVVLLAGSAQAAAISGSVTDSSGGALTTARITLLNVATGGQLSTAADSAGRYRFDNLSVGLYRVAIEQTGFSEVARTVALAEDDDLLEVNFILRVGSLSATVTVTASRAERDTLEVPLRVDALAKTQLETLNPENTGEAMVQLAGITPVGSGPYQTRPRLRGLDSTRVLILVDGERLNNARTATDRSGTEVGLVDLSSVESVEVVSGAGSVLYGTDALSGTINLITPQPTFSDRTKFLYGFDGFVSTNGRGRRGAITLGASAKRYTVNVVAGAEHYDSYKAGKNFRETSQPYYTSGQIRQADTIDDNFGFAFKAFPDPFNAPFTRTSADVAASGAEGNNLNVTGMFAIKDRQTLRVKYVRRRVENVGFPDFVPPYFFQTISLPHSDFDRVSARYEAREIRPWFSNLRVSTYYQDQDRLLRNNFPVQFPAPTAQSFFPINVFRLQIQSDTRQHVQTPGVDVQGTFVFARRHVLTAGSTIYVDRSVDERETTTQTTLIGNVSLGARGPQAVVFPSAVALGGPSVSHPVRVPNARFRDVGVFAQDEFALTPTVKLVGGLRVDSYGVVFDATPGYEIESLIAGATALDRSKLPNPAGDRLSRTAFTGDLGVVVSPTNQVSLVAHYGRSYRHPNLEELLFAGPATVGVIIPNVKVGPERGDNVDVGVKIRSGRFSGAATYFDNRYDGFISTEIATTGAQGPISQAQNFADVRIRGLELDGEAPVALSFATLSLFGNVAWTRGDVLSGVNQLNGKSLANTPFDNISPLKAVTGVRLTDRRNRFWIEYANRLQKRVDRVAPTLLESGFLIAQDLLSLEGFGVHRIGWGIDFNKAPHRLGVSFAIENLTDRFYREQFQFAPARGRSFTVGVHVKGA